MKTEKKGLHQKGTLFFPNSVENQQKKGLHQQWNIFFLKFKWTPKLRYTPESNYWEGCRCRPYSNYWGGYSQIIGGYIPHLPRVSAPLVKETDFCCDSMFKIFFFIVSCIPGKVFFVIVDLVIGLHLVNKKYNSLYSLKQFSLKAV